MMEIFFPEKWNFGTCCAWHYQRGLAANLRECEKTPTGFVFRYQM